MERKLSAIVAADVVNYCILMGRNELGTIRALEAVRREVVNPAAAKYKGRIVRYMGDGTLLAFESAVDAVQFAMDVQSLMAERNTTAPQDMIIDFRMGANLCDIIQRADDIHGEGVNVAVRLEELAPPGGICLSQSIYLQTKNIFGAQLFPIGERQLKNIIDPVQVWRWQPPGIADGICINGNFAPSRKHYHGRQILDPKVTAILVDLHMRSARLAISDFLDDILVQPEAGRNMSMEDIYRRLGHRLNHARGLLRSISIEYVDNIQDFASGLWQSPQSMSEFVANVFDSSNTSYAARLLPQLQRILQSKQAVNDKRTQIMELIRTFMNEEMGPRVKKLIKFAFVEP